MTATHYLQTFVPKMFLTIVNFTQNFFAFEIRTIGLFDWWCPLDKQFWKISKDVACLRTPAAVLNDSICLFGFCIVCLCGSEIWTYRWTVHMRVWRTYCGFLWNLIFCKRLLVAMILEINGCMVLNHYKYNRSNHLFLKFKNIPLKIEKF